MELTTVRDPTSAPTLNLFDEVAVGAKHLIARREALCRESAIQNRTAQPTTPVLFTVVVDVVDAQSPDIVVSARDARRLFFPGVVGHNT